jgi:hypothetical protein
MAPSITAATISMVILLDAPNWRDANDAYEMLQGDFRLHAER